MGLKDSDMVSGLTVIHTPGHTDGGISLYKENEAIFVGDALRTDSSGRPRLPSGPMTLNMQQAKDSVKNIAGYQYRVLLPGHGPPTSPRRLKNHGRLRQGNIVNCTSFNSISFLPLGLAPRS
jgi:glyoxylase-like metal-dependent hydrolase (beta-lactamase superfamily II)